MGREAMTMKRVYLTYIEGIDRPAPAPWLDTPSRSLALRPLPNSLSLITYPTLPYSTLGRRVLTLTAAWFSLSNRNSMDLARESLSLESSRCTGHGFNAFLPSSKFNRLLVFLLAGATVSESMSVSSSPRGWWPWRDWVRACVEAARRGAARRGWSLGVAAAAVSVSHSRSEGEAG